MSEWWTYSLADFLMFSPRTYYRLLELYNVAIWPAQLAGVAIGVGVAAWSGDGSRRNGRVVAGLLAVCWLWVAFAFHYPRYAQINWAAPWFAAACTLQASLLLVLGVLAGRIVLQAPNGGQRWIIPSLIMVVVVAYPLLAVLADRSWTTTETFGAAPDPTAIATVAVLGLCRGQIRWLLLIVPLLWCAVAVATLWAMDSWQAIVVAGAALAALVPAMRGPRHVGPRAIR